MHSSTHSVAIIIVNYKGRDDTLACLESLQALTYPRTTVYVVDQASNDGTPEMVRTRFPHVHLLENPVNDGFAGGNNFGLRHALADGADYVFLLNNDTLVAPNLLEPLVEEMERDPRVGMCGPLMLYASAPDTVWAAGGQMGTEAQSTLLQEGQPADTISPDVRDVDFVVGCGLLVRRTVCETVGLMDDRFFLYYEESDWCARARQAGWRIVSVPCARLWHKVSQSTGTESELTLYYMRRGALLYLQKNSPRHRLQAAIIADARLALVWLLRGKARRSRVLLQAVWDALRHRWGRSDFAFR